MTKFCYICQGKIAAMEDYRTVKGLFIHRMTLSPDGERRYCNLLQQPWMASSGRTLAV